MGKSQSNKKADEKKVKRSSYTGRIVNGREIILTVEAEEYLKKMGYKIIKPNVKTAVYTFTLTFLIIGFYTLLNNITI